MSIAEKQSIKALSRLIQKALQKGYLPTIRELQKNLQEHFKKYPPGLPTMRLRPAPYRGRSSAEDWNQTIDEIHDDLNTLYEENLDQVERILTNFDYVETQKRKIEHKMKDLEEQIREMVLLNNNLLPQYLYSFTETFTSLTNVDMENTNSFVDLEAGEVTPMPTATGTVKIPLYPSNVREFLPNDKGILSSTTIQPISNALDSYNNTAWLHKIVSDSIQKVSYMLKITPSNLHKINRIAIQPNNTDKVTIQVRVTEDTVNWRTVFNKAVQDRVIIDLPSLELRGVEITMSKEDNDGQEEVNGVLGEVYYFGLSEISLLEMGFENYSTYQSKPITIRDNNGEPAYISKVALEVDEEKSPPNNWIKYYVALNEKDPQWQPITPIKQGQHIDINNTESRTAPPTVVNFNEIQTTVPIIAHSAGASTSKYGTYNGLDVYSITAEYPNRKIIPGSARMFRGYQQWRQERYNHLWDEEEKHIPTGQDWVNLPGGLTKNSINTMYIDVNPNKRANDVFRVDSPGGNYRWTTSVYSNEPDNKTRARLSISTPGYVTIYINNREVIGCKGVLLEKDKPVELNLVFEKGWNVIQVLFYQRNSTPQGVTQTINLGFNPLMIADKIFTDIAPLTLCSEFDILHNVKERETTFFAFSSKNQVLINNTMRQQGARYYLIYDYYLNNKEQQLLVKAELGKEAGTVQPPKLRSYHLRILS